MIWQRIFKETKKSQYTFNSQPLLIQVLVTACEDRELTLLFKIKLSICARNTQMYRRIGASYSQLVSLPQCKK